MNVNYLCRFNASPVDEYSSTREEVQLSTRVQFSLLVSTLHSTIVYYSRLTHTNTHTCPSLVVGGANYIAILILIIR